MDYAHLLTLNVSRAMKTIEITFTAEQYATILDAMQRAGFSSLESFVYSVIVQQQDY